MSKDQKRLDNYQPLKFYQSRAGNNATGFSQFSEGAAHYFTYHQDGNIVLLSEGLATEIERDRRMVSVQQSLPQQDRYRFNKHKNGKSYFDIVDDTHTNIATSDWFASIKEAKQAAQGLMTGDATELNVAPEILASQSGQSAKSKTVKTRGNPWIKWILAIIVLAALAGGAYKVYSISQATPSAAVGASE